jgi:hypothetical protein
MTIKKLLMPILMFAVAIPSSASDKHKKKVDRGMLERMEAVPCGAKQRGLTGLGSIFASVGIEAVNSEEKLCPQYLLRTDEMEYHIRPSDLKHAVLLPVGDEAEFKIKKNRMYLKVPDGDKKRRVYQVVAMNPLQTGENAGAGSSYRPASKTAPYRAPEQPMQKAGTRTADSAPNPPPQ